MHILPYTFITTPYLEQLQSALPNIFVFHKLTEDFSNFKSIIEKEKPEVIIGIAKCRRKAAVFEKLAINQFHKTKSVVKNGQDSYNLYIPPHLQKPFSISHLTSDTFCNWTMYKIADYLHQQNLTTKLSFIHLHEVFLADFLSYLKVSILTGQQANRQTG